MPRSFLHRLRGHDVSEAGHLVRRLLPSPRTPMIGPFVLFDAFGPARLSPGEGVEIAPHGHAHLATITHFFAGASHHTDDLGNDVVIEAGDVAWMHAGSGIVHAERTPDAFRREGGIGHGIQAWVALPESLERSAPRLQLVRADAIPTITRGDLVLRVLVGEALGAASPIETSSKVLLLEARAWASAGETHLDRGARAIFFAEGCGAVNEVRVGVGTMLVLHEGDAHHLRLEPESIALVLGGDALGTRYLQGNVIGSSVERLEQALREMQR